MPEFNIMNGTINKVGIWTGDIIDYLGVRYRITKINPKNYKLMRETDGRTFNLDKSARGIKKSDDQTWAGPKEKTEYELAMEAVNAGIVLGTIVKLTPVNLASQYPGYYAVIAKPNTGTLRLAKVGDQGDRYLRNIKPSEVEVVPPKDMVF